MNDLGKLHSHRALALERLRGLIVECEARLREGRSGLTSLISPAAEAAPLAATLGFPVPPIEYVITKRPDHHPLLDAHPAWESIVTLRLNDPTSRLTYVALDLSANASAEQVTSEPDRLPGMTSSVHLRMMRTLGSWQRRLDDLDVDAVRLSPTSGHEARSWQQERFDYQLERELGDNFQCANDLETERHVLSPDVVKSMEARCREMAEQLQLVATIPLDEDDQTPQDRYIFRRYGDGWLLRFGEEEGSLKDLRGLSIVHALLSSPGKQIAVSALSNQQSDNTAKQSVLDPEYRAEVSKQLADYDAQIDRAEASGDVTTADVLRREQQGIKDQLAAASGLHGKSRAFNDDLERARNRVSKQISNVSKRLEECSPPLSKLAAHLTQSIAAETGHYAYRPDQQIAWVLG